MENTTPTFTDEQLKTIERYKEYTKDTLIFMVMERDKLLNDILIVNIKFSAEKEELTVKVANQKMEIQQMAKEIKELKSKK